MSGAGWGRHRVRLGLALLALPGLVPARAQYERPKQVLTGPEREAIETNRRLAGPRPTTPRPALSATEVARVSVFKGARHSVVFISSITKKWFLEDNRTGDRYQVPPASGTGFVWDNLGHVVTNHHVVTVEEPRRRPPGRGRGSPGHPHRRQDLQGPGDRPQPHPGHRRAARVRSAGADEAAAPRAPRTDLQVGQMVMAIGNPFGLDHTLTTGVVSALGRDILTGFGTHITDAIQTDAAINPGNSGGPLLDRAGRLIGMNTAIRTTTGISAGIGFAIPVDTLNRMVPSLIAKGQLHRPELGISHLPAERPAGQPGPSVVDDVDSVTRPQPSGPGRLAACASARAQGTGEPADVILRVSSP